MQTELIEYQANDLVMEGFLAVGDSSAAKQPLVLVVHDWTGNGEFSQEKAKYFAKQGFIGFAVDLYGKGKRGRHGDRGLNQKLLGELLQDRAQIIPRLQAALDCALSMAQVDSKKIMTIGFCMGGLCVLDFARSGAPVAGTVSVHGGLNAAPTTSNKPITSKILVLHGHEDKGVKPENVIEFETEMTQRGADWQVHVFGNTYHAFTNPLANDMEMGLVYNSVANTRTWHIVRAFSDEIFS